MKLKQKNWRTEKNLKSSHKVHEVRPVGMQAVYDGKDLRRGNLYHEVEERISD